MINQLFSQDILWQMSSAERASVLYLLSQTRANSIAIEVGSYKGGFTHQLATHFKKVYSLDIDHSNIANKDRYKNVEWITGDSAETLPWLINKIGNKDISFILIDGDHKYSSVLQDINNILEYIPIVNTILLMHDSWYPETREAINKANWNDNQFVHLVEKDFVPGDLVYPDFVGGLAIAYLDSIMRNGDITIQQSQDFMWSKCKQLLDQEKEHAKNSYWITL